MKTNTRNIIAFFIFIITLTFNAYASNVIYTDENTTSKKTTKEESIKKVEEKNYEDDDGISVYIDEETGKRIKDVNYPVNQSMKDSGIVEEAVRQRLKEKEPVRKISKDTILSLDQYYKTYINEPKEYKYIQHTSSITIVDSNYEWSKEIDNTTKESKWVLTYNDYNMLRMAKSGFYKIDNKTYYFDENGYMYVGKIMDDRDIVYEFGEDGAMIE